MTEVISVILTTIGVFTPVVVAGVMLTAILDETRRGGDT